MKYFAGVKTVEELRKTYRVLLKKYHPDNEQGSVCKCQYKNVAFLSYKNVGKPTRLYDIFCILIFLNHVLHLIL